MNVKHEVKKKKKGSNIIRSCATFLRNKENMIFFFIFCFYVEFKTCCENYLYLMSILETAFQLDLVMYILEVNHPECNGKVHYILWFVS